MTRFATILIFLALQGCFPSTSCEPDSDAVTFAKSLPQERLAALYRDSKRLLDSDPDVYIAPVPSEFKYLEPIDMRLWGQTNPF
jgi:hypothetical protein